MSKTKKIAVLSDIHGNYIALKRCVDYALERGINIFVFLGDYVGDLAYPQKTMTMLYDLAERYECYFLKGNKENYWLHYRKVGEQGWREEDSTTRTLLYTYRNLVDRDFQFFATLNFVQSIEFEGFPAITACHGSPEKVNGTLLPNHAETSEIIGKDANEYILCGHTHIQQNFVHSRKVVLNPGSVGMPLESDGKAQFMILYGENGTWQEEFVSLEYNVSEVIADLKEAGLDKAAPFWYKVTVNSLHAGRKSQSHGSVLGRSMELCKQKYGRCVWPDVPEECWEQAFWELILNKQIKHDLEN